MMSIIYLLAALALGLAGALVFAALTARWRIAVDLTPVEHAIVAVAVQTGWALAVGDWWAGAAIGIALFVGREHAQAEARYIAAHGGSRRATPRLPELGALSPSVWRVGDVLDVAAPAAATLILAGVLYAAA